LELSLLLALAFSFAFILTDHSSSVSSRRPPTSAAGDELFFLLCSTDHKWPTASSIDGESRSRSVSIEIATCSNFSGTK
jgi:hypothetical protein